MVTPILATKLYIPKPRRDLVPRGRLIERLSDSLDRKLTLISAPAGFGKTTLVSSWIDQLRAMNDDLREETASKSQIVNRIAWLSLDEGDNDLNRFMTYLVAALQTVEPDIGADALAMLQSPQSPSPEAMLTMLLNDISTTQDNSSIGSGQGFVLVLDDYHMIESKAIDEVLAFLIEYLPPHLHLVVATREDPALPVARLRARGQMTELRAADLRFTPAEAADFLNQAMGLNLSEEDIAALETRTEGWIAGLQLAALALQGPGQPDVAAFIQSFTGSHRFVMDYLVEEVLHQQPENVQTFLLQTSILERLCGSLCDAVMLDQTIDGQATLEYLEQANLFIVPLDSARGWYRYHHLFADLLQQRLERNSSAALSSPNNVAALHRRASVWYEENGQRTEALHHALAAQDFERAASLIERTWRAMDESRRSATWLGWAKKLPDALIRTRPVLNVGYAWASLSAGDLEAADVRLREAEAWLDSNAEISEQHRRMVVADNVEFQTLPASIAGARTYWALSLGDIPGTLKYARQALKLWPTDNPLRRTGPATMLGLASWASGDLDVAHRSFSEALASYQQAGHLLLAITGTHILADIRLAQGRLRDAVETYQQSFALVAEHGGIVQWGTADLHTRFSELHLEQNDLEAADQHLSKSKALGEQSTLPHWRWRWCLAQARLKAAQGDLDESFNLLDEAERNYIRGPVPDVRPIAALKARLRVRQGRLAEALDWAREQGLSADDDLSYLREFEHITLARIRIAQFKSEGEAYLIAEAMDLLDRLLQAAETGGRTGSVIEILILQALAHQTKGDIRSALPPLERALTLAEPEGYVRIFIDEGAPMVHLLSAAVAQKLVPDYVARLLAVFEAAGLQPRDNAPPDKPLVQAAQPLIEPLSDRELEVLHLVAQGLSNRQISERLFLALSTVKGHNRTIFGKLQVKRRTEAVSRARELGLL